MNWDDLMSEKSYNAWGAYIQSKLANILFTRALAKRLQGTNVTANALHPGVVRTEIQRHMPATFGFLFHIGYNLVFPILCVFFKSPYQGAQTSVYCALSEELDNVSGKYFVDCREEKLLPHALSDEDAERLWNISAKLTQL